MHSTCDENVECARVSIIRQEVRVRAKRVVVQFLDLALVLQAVMRGADAQHLLGYGPATIRQERTVDVIYALAAAPAFRSSQLTTFYASTLRGADAPDDARCVRCNLVYA